MGFRLVAQLHLKWRDPAWLESILFPHSSTVPLVSDAVIGFLPNYRLAVEILGVILVALTGHLGGFLSGVNGRLDRSESQRLGDDRMKDGVCCTGRGRRSRERPVSPLSSYPDTLHSVARCSRSMAVFPSIPLSKVPKYSAAVCTLGRSFQFPTE